MCSICNINEYKTSEDMPDTLIMSLGMSEEIKICHDTKSKKYFLSTGNNKSNYTIYRCPTCGRKLY